MSTNCGVSCEKLFGSIKSLFITTEPSGITVSRTILCLIVSKYQEYYKSQKVQRENVGFIITNGI